MNGIIAAAIQPWSLRYIFFSAAGWISRVNSNASINVKPEGGTPGIRGAFDFSEEVLVKIPTVGPQNWVKYPHLGEVISLKLIVVAVYILQIIVINCQAFSLIYYSTIMSFHQIRSRERAKYETVIHCNVPV